MFYFKTNSYRTTRKTRPPTIGLTKMSAEKWSEVNADMMKTMQAKLISMYFYYDVL